MEKRIETSPPPEVKPEHKKVFQIHLLGSSSLRVVSQAIPEITDDIRELADIMVNTMSHVRGVGLAAPQIGVGLRVFVMQHQGEGILKLANPEISTTEGEQNVEEGCLSQPGLMVTMKRPKAMSVKCLDITTGNTVIVEGTDLEAAILSHEIDHLNATLICDSLSRLKREMYTNKLKKKIKEHDRAERAQAARIIMATRDERDHPHFHEPHK